MKNKLTDAELKERKRIRDKARYEKNKEKFLQRCKEYKQKNKEHLAISNKNYHQKNKETIKERKQLTYLKNKHKSKIKNKIWRENNKEHILEYNRNYYNTRMINDNLFKLKNIIRASIRHSFKRTNYNKNSKTIEILGCTFEDFKIYLESKFETWMNWDNYGSYNGEFNYGWDIDHIIPLSKGTSEENIVKLNHFTNLQPLCSKVNRDIKIDKLSNFFS